MKSTGQHLAEGTFRPERHGLRLDAPRSEQSGANCDKQQPAKPLDLPPAASTLWDLILASHSTAFWATDAATLEACVRWWARLLDLQKRLEAADADSEYKLTCLCAVATKNFQSLSAKLGLSPVDRGRLLLAKPLAESTPNPFEILRTVKCQ